MQIPSQISSLWQEKRHFYLSKIDLSPLKLSSHLMAYHRLQNTHVNCAWARRPTMVSNSPNPPKIRSLDFKQIHMIYCIPFIFKICQTVAGITKGQLISKANSKLFISTKKPTKILLYFCPSLCVKEFKSRKYKINIW